MGAGLFLIPDTDITCPYDFTDVASYKTFRDHVLDDGVFRRLAAALHLNLDPLLRVYTDELDDDEYIDMYGDNEEGRQHIQADKQAHAASNAAAWQAPAEVRAALETLIHEIDHHTDLFTHVETERQRQSYERGDDIWSFDDPYFTTGDFRQGLEDLLHQVIWYQTQGGLKICLRVM